MFPDFILGLAHFFYRNQSSSPTCPGPSVLLSAVPSPFLYVQLRHSKPAGLNLHFRSQPRSFTHLSHALPPLATSPASPPLLPTPSSTPSLCRCKLRGPLLTTTMAFFVRPIVIRLVKPSHLCGFHYRASSPQMIESRLAIQELPPTRDANGQRAVLFMPGRESGG